MAVVSARVTAADAAFAAVRDFFFASRYSVRLQDQRAPNPSVPRGARRENVGEELDLPFEPTDLALTAGAFGAIMVAIRLLLDSDDEAVISEPA